MWCFYEQLPHPCRRREACAPAVIGQSCAEEGRTSVCWLVSGGAGQGGVKEGNTKEPAETN